MSTHPKPAELEARMRILCDDLDHYLEDTYGEYYPLHPNRPKRGQASSVAYDGLFSTGTQFTLGYGSDYGRGYLVTVEIRTLARVDDDHKKEIEKAAMEYLKEIIPVLKAKGSKLDVMTKVLSVLPPKVFSFLMSHVVFSPKSMSYAIQAHNHYKVGYAVQEVITDARKYGIKAPRLYEVESLITEQ